MTLGLNHSVSVLLCVCSQQRDVRANTAASPRAHHHLITFQRIVVVRVGRGEDLKLAGDLVQLRVPAVRFPVVAPLLGFVAVGAAVVVVGVVAVETVVVALVQRHALTGVFVAETFSAAVKNV